MSSDRKRRIVRRAVMVLAVVVVLPVWYVSAWLTVSWAEHESVISSGAAQRARPAFVPLVNYCKSELPGSGVLGQIWWAVNPPVIFEAKFGNGELTARGCIISSLAPPKTADVEEFLKAEFPRRKRAW